MKAENKISKKVFNPPISPAKKEETITSIKR
jgi:hypothetical protein